MDHTVYINNTSSLPTLLTLLETEKSIAEGATNLLSVFNSNNASGSAGNQKLQLQVELELKAARERIEKLEREINARELPELEMPAIRSRTPLSTSPNGSNQFKLSPIAFESQASPSTSQSNILKAQTPYEIIMMMIFKLDQLQEEGQEGLGGGGNNLVIVKHMDAIVVLLASHAKVRFELKLEDVLTPILRCLSEKSGKELRASTYRLLRHLIVDQHDVNQLQTRYFDLFLLRSLARDSKHELEKEQALRLVRHLLNLPDADRPVPSSVIRSIISIAEAADERLRLACLETLGELLIRDIPLLIHSEGLRVILQTLSDGPHDLSPYLALGFLWVMDRPGTRDYLRPGVDIEIVLAGFTEVHLKSTSQEERVRTSAKIITQMLQSWTGMMYLSLNEKQAIRSLVDSLTTPSTSVREILLDTLVNIFQIKTPDWYKSTLSRRGQVPSKVQSSPSSPSSPSKSGRTNLVDQYLAILLLVFIDAGLIEVLVSVAASSKDSTSAPKVSFLIGEILHLSNRVLPLSYAARVQALPKLFSLASSFDTSDARLAATYTLGAVDEYNRKSLRKEDVIEGTRNRSNSMEESIKRGQKQLNTARIRQAQQIDDISFRNLLLETQVLTTKTHTKWSVDTMQEILEGPLLNSKRLDEAMRASKFVSRLMAFFQPLNYRYSELKKNPDNVKFTKLGCTLITTLLANPDGVRFLAEEKLIRHIADCLLQLDPTTATSSGDGLLSKSRMERTVVGGYFEMLGTLTKSTEGLKLLEQNKVFSSFYRISDLPKREDLVAAILDNVDYSKDGHTRVLLSKALTSSSKNIRIYATQLLTKLIEESVLVPEWQIRLLLTQIYDTSIEICEMVVKVLEVACENLETLELVVKMRPSLDHLGEIGAVLLTRFFSTSIGVRYLHEIEFIDGELDDWFNHRNSLYVVQVELLLASVLKLDTASETSYDGVPPPHFYSELVKTDEGCMILDESGHFLEFTDFIRQHGLEDFDSEIIGQLKSALWAVGHIGSSEKGLPFLEQEDIVMSIVEIAEDSPVYSLRGTACFVLGLISSTLEGVEILDELGWESVVTPLGSAMGLCVPRVIANLVDTPLWSVPTADIPESLFLGSPSNHLEREALTAFANLSNHILASKASKSLARLKSRHRELFSSHALFYRALQMLSNNHYRLSVRRYILEMFDLTIDLITVVMIEAAGEGLKSRRVEEGDRNGSGWDLFGERKIGVVDDILKGIEGEFTDDEESLHGEEGVKIPLQVLSPLLRVKGFIC